MYNNIEEHITFKQTMVQYTYDTSLVSLINNYNNIFISQTIRIVGDPEDYS